MRDRWSDETKRPDEGIGSLPEKQLSNEDASSVRGGAETAHLWLKSNGTNASGQLYDASTTGRTLGQ